MIKEIPIWNHSFESELEDIKKNHDTVTHIVLNFLNENSFNTESFLLDVIKISKQYSIPVIMLTSYCEEINGKRPITDHLKSNIEVIEWPMYFLSRTFNFMGNSNNINLVNGYDLFNHVETDQDFQYLYISLNNITKPHRCEMMDQLAAKSLIERGAIAWHDLLREIPDINQLGSVYTNYPYKHWQPKLMLLDQNRNVSNGQFIQELIPLEYKNSFCQIVPETECDDFFLTEKTSVPLFFCKPFLVVGCKDFHRILESFGFKLYDEIFDYSFDSHDSYQERCKGIADNIDRLSKLNKQELKKLNTTLKEKMLFNRNLALEIATTKFSPDMLKFVNQYYNILNDDNAIKHLLDYLKENEIYNAQH